MSESKQETVCVTGASGFIASYIIQALLSKGYTVRGTVRSVSDLSKYAYLTNLPNAQENLTLHEANLEVEGSFDSVIEGCDYVLHTASPYIVTAKDPQRDLVDPALNGTKNVLASCSRNPQLKKVVVTSSLAAITEQPENGHVYTEEDWNTTSSLTRNAYYYSKTLAERYVWEFVENERPHFDVACVNPAIVLGPEMSNPKTLNESNLIFRRFFSCLDMPAVVDFDFPVVDVRDVADLHVLVMENEDAEGRFLAVNTSEKMIDIVKKLRELYPKKTLPRIRLDSAAGTAMTKVFVTLTKSKGERDYAMTHLGRHHSLDNSKSKSLGFEYRDVWETFQWLCDWMIENKYI